MFTSPRSRCAGGEQTGRYGIVSDDAGSGGAGGTGARSDLEKGVGALKRFQTRVNALLTELENGAAGNKKVAAHRISRSSFSGGNLPFAEADGFFTQYNRVHAEIVKLSKSLGDQIEMLSIGVHAAEVGFNNVEDELRQRFHTIRTRIDDEHEKQDRTHGDRGSEPGKSRSESETVTKDMG
ncbi:hypothetical protein ACFRMN_31745 [Streptomyces sp. NPDC056835]|uniref:hypothetical protein n=1 Tax=Streptomyces sp. NPDC056835 TaxID=3345956 RepID=UPI003679DBEA